MDFRNMKDGCPWIDETMDCMATNIPCREYSCAVFHWICELVDNLQVSIKADIKVD